MSDYLFCTSSPRQPGILKFHVSCDDPRVEASDAMRARRAMGAHTLEWTLPVVDRALTDAAFKKALLKHWDKKAAGYTCDPMAARGEAIKLTTLRPPVGASRKRKPSLLRRLIRAA